MKKIIVLILMGLSLFIVSCKDNGGNSAQNEFLGNYKSGVYVGGTSTFILDESLHQTSYDPTGFTFYRIQTDDQSKYLHIEMNNRPSWGTGQKTTLKISSRGLDLADGNYEVLVKKKSDNTVWLWSADKSIGFIVP